jgi:hypothetical protein
MPLRTIQIRTISKIIFRILCLVAILGVTNGVVAASKKLLVVTVTKGFRHGSIPTAEKVLGQLAKSSGAFEVDYVRNDDDMKTKMTLESLKKFDGVIFANTTGDLPLPDKDGFIKWVKSGKAFIGMHSCSDTFHGFPAFVDMLGGEFQTHGAQATVVCLNEDLKHPAVRHFGENFTIHDEIYLLKSFHRNRVHGLLSLDKHPNSKMPGDYPIAWSKKVGLGNIFYTSLGHRNDVWENEKYQTHILGGIRWALGLAKGDSKPQDTRYSVSKKEKKEGFKALFNGIDLDGWAFRNPKGLKSWSAQNGMLVNEIPSGKHGTDIVSNSKFRDFTVRYEYMIPSGSNSGFYLRGRHEIQILDDYKNGTPKPGGNGGIYGFSAPSKFVSRKPGQWQSAEATIRGDLVTVVLNGVKIHDGLKVDRSTGGHLDENVDQPGPIMLQGDHGAIAFRKIRIKSLQ